jgi:hypothetical protein
MLVLLAFDAILQVFPSAAEALATGNPRAASNPPALS